MKHYFISIVVFLSACSNGIAAKYPRNPTLTHQAYHYIGLDERKDRKVLKDITGVDPVYTEWCAAFVNMVLFENGYATSASVSPYPLMARSFQTYGEKVIDEPKKGDIVVFTRGREGWKGHVGFYVSHTVVDGVTIYNVLGGNQSNAVTIEPYSGSRLIDIRRPLVVSENSDS